MRDRWLRRWRRWERRGGVSEWGKFVVVARHGDMMDSNLEGRRTVQWCKWGGRGSLRRQIRGARWATLLSDELIIAHLHLSLLPSLSVSVSVSVRSLSPRVGAQMAWLLLHGLCYVSLTWYGCRIPKSLPPPPLPNQRGQPTASCRSMSRWSLRNDRPRVKTSGELPQHFRGICGICLKLAKKNRNITPACHRLDLRTRGFWLIIYPKISSDNWPYHLPFYTLAVSLNPRVQCPEKLFGDNGSKFECFQVQPVTWCGDRLVFLY